MTITIGQCDHYEHSNSHKEITGSLKGVDLFYTPHFGHHFKVKIVASGISYKIVLGEMIDDFLPQLAKKA
jgi:hypothetical protein